MHAIALPGPTPAPHRKTTKDTRDDWRTPPRIAGPTIERFRFTGDAAADPINTLAPAWLSETDDAIASQWDSLGKKVWMNPPYSRTQAFIRRARTEAQVNGRIVVCLVPSTTDVKWFHLDVIPHAQEVWYYSGRISFISPITGEAVSGNPVGSMLVVFSGEQSYAGARIGQLCAKTGTPITEADGHYWRRCRPGGMSLFD